MDFLQQKVQRLEHVDLSRKGSVDIPLLDTVKLINDMPQFFTTSSCSGRIILFENVASKVQKKGCKWLHVSHDPVQVESVEDALKDLTDEAVFKFEPMVMHIQCQGLDGAQKMHQAAVAAGFRNSGITVGTKGKIMMAVRSTHSLEAPVSSNGELLVSHQYLKYLTESANRKMEENFSRIKRFHENVKLQCEEKDPDLSEKASKSKKVRKFGSEKLPKPEEALIEDSRENKTGIQIENSDEDDDMSLFMFENT